MGQRPHTNAFGQPFDELTANLDIIRGAEGEWLGGEPGRIGAHQTDGYPMLEPATDSMISLLVGICPKNFIISIQVINLELE